ncbi:hypothetical protein AN639_02395 [Candidatus Epulonipiscium fishelsonii]|uniref:Uncharacterized protein n=1 Tax=Candidatus Epulonipiscium fishelsonii TaxID=77094 RepID=A0ACC8XAY6_9FIRM|nr:hypothetical protein AN396_07635 [Epulopiscium sp. SCG-B11WGA-EpuloA1]ONI41978.1 hypothetical protein AN639_02395 [Epulopiscium sp. SCG-B05WGA-EpuloA1]
MKSDVNLVKRLTVAIGGVVTLILLSLIIIVVIQVYSSSVKDTHLTFETKAELNANKVQEVINTVDGIAKNLQSYIQSNFGSLNAKLDCKNGLNTNVKFSMVYGTLMDENKVIMERYIVNTAWSALSTNSDISVLAVYFEPYVFDKALSTYGLETHQENLKAKTLTPIFSYESFANKEFYSVTKQTLKPHISDPMLDDNGNMVYYVSYPIIYKDEFKGVIVINVLSTSFDEIIFEKSTYETSFSSVFNQDWDIIYDYMYPELINVNMSEMISSREMQELTQLGEQKDPFHMKSEVIGGEKYERYLYPIKALDKTWWAHISIESQEFYSEIWVLIGIISAVSIISLLILILVTKNILAKALKPLDQVVSAASQMSQGDLDIHLNISRQDEIGMLGQEFDDMSNSLKEIILDIKQVLGNMAQGDFTSTINAQYKGAFFPIKTSLIQIGEKLSHTLASITRATETVSSGAENIAKGAVELANGTIEQSTIVQEFHSITNEIEESIIKTTLQAEETSKISIEAKQQATQGNIEMEKMLLSMNAINQSSQTISVVLKTVEDIASQTNLLALNASIEATRAGENGKGFAVVAEEVRKLAFRSSETVKEIDKIINMSMEDISRGQDVASNVALSLQQIVNTIERTTTISEELLKTSTSQKHTLDNLIAGTEHISILIQTNSSTSQEAAAISEELAKEAKNLSELMQYFKINK